MGKRCKYTFLQGTHTDSQRAGEKMANVANYQRNANQECNSKPPPIGQNGHH